MENRDVDSDPVERQESVSSDAEVAQEEPTLTVNEAISSFETRFNDIEVTLSELRKLFEQRIRYDEGKDKALDTLYDEMKQYKSGFQAFLKENMIRSLLLLHDSISSTKANFRKEKVPEHLLEQLDLLRQELLDILSFEDVEPMGKVGETFDNRSQQVLRTVPTPDPAKNNLIAGTVREGFKSGERVLRPRSVAVCRYVPPAHNHNEQKGE